MQNFKNENLIVELTEDKIETENIIQKMKDPKGGAISIFLGTFNIIKLLFIGTTRDNFENKKVILLSYEAHPTMAIKELNKIALFAKEKFKLLKIALIHRIKEVVFLH